MQQTHENSVLVICYFHLNKFKWMLRASELCMNSRALGYLKYGMLQADDWNQTSYRFLKAFAEHRSSKILDVLGP